ncbi:MAG: hypothetical protein RL154_671 [Pseudomonadota bacterium]
MKLAQILDKLNEISPFALSESWDSSGLQIGDLDSEIDTVFLSLECDSGVIKECPSGSLIIAHHPLIFKPLKNLNFSLYPQSAIKEIIKKDISVIAMHTNFDTTHLNIAFANSLGLSGGEACGYVYKVAVDLDFNDLLLSVKEKLELNSLSYVKPCKDKIKSIAIICGSGGDLIDKIDADVFITGDIKYHQAISANERGLGVIDASHYASENHFAPLMQELLKNSGIDAKIIKSQNPLKVLI